MLAFCLAALMAAPSPAPADSVDLPYYPAPISMVDVAGRAVAVYDTGGEGEPVVLLHGLGTNLAFWREGRVLGCLPRVRDWSDYMAAIPRLLAD